MSKYQEVLDYFDETDYIVDYEYPIGAKVRDIVEFRNNINTLQELIDKSEKKQYIVLTNGEIGYVDYICICDKCRERGVAEIRINNLRGEYERYIVANELQDVAYYGNDYKQAIEVAKPILIRNAVESINEKLQEVTSNTPEVYADLRKALIDTLGGGESND